MRAGVCGAERVAMWIAAGTAEQTAARASACPAVGHGAGAGSASRRARRRLRACREEPLLLLRLAPRLLPPVPAKNISAK